MPPSGPTFLVAGTARAGTTALIFGLKQHPDVFITDPKEPHYFAFHGTTPAFTGPGDEEWVNQRSITDEGRYVTLFDAAGKHSARGDGSATTLYYAEHAAPEIRRLAPDARVVVLLREPVERAYSSYSYLRLRGVETAPDFGQALALEESRRALGWHHMWHYRGMSRYAESLKILMDELGPERVGVWFYDDLDANYGRVVTEVAQFLGLKPFPAPPVLPRVNVSGTARSNLAQGALRWATKHETVRASIKRLVPFERRERLRSLILRRDAVDPAIRADLQAGFEDDLAALPQLLDIPLPPWIPGTPSQPATG